MICERTTVAISLNSIGDVRNLESVKEAMRGVDYIFHAATALKQVPSCEFTWAQVAGVIWLPTMFAAAIDEGVKKVVCLSTDKAAYLSTQWELRNMMGKRLCLPSPEMSIRAKPLYVAQDTVCDGLKRFSHPPFFTEQLNQ